MISSEDFKIFASTINGEAGASSVESQKTIAHSIMNRVGKREWKRHKSPVDIIKNTGYDAYTQKNSPYGHIAGYTGNQWISDFKQKSMVIYKDKVTYHFYRMTGD